MMTQRIWNAEPIRKNARCTAALLVALLASYETEGFTQTVVRDSAGVEIVENTDQLWGEGEAWRLSSQPVVDIGAVETDPGHQLYRVIGAFVLEDGRIVVGNAGTHELRFYDSAGNLLSSSGRKGGGPGEFEDLMWLWVLPGDTMLAYDRELCRLSVFDPEGEFVRSFTLREALAGIAPFPTHMAVFSDGSLLMAAQRLLGSGEVETGLRRDSALYLHCDIHGTVIDTVGRLPGSEVYIRTHSRGLMAVAPPFMRAPAVAVYGADFYFGSNDSYEIAYYSREGELERLIRKDQPNLQITARDIESYKKLELEKAPTQSARDLLERMLSEMPFPETMPAYEALIVDAAGNLWVQDYRRPGDNRSRWTVFNHDGRLLGVVEGPSGYSLYQVGTDFVLGLWRDNFDVEHVRLYKLVEVPGRDK